MDRIIVLSQGVPIRESHRTCSTKAVVAANMQREDAQLLAELLRMPFASLDEVFSLSPQSLRFPPTRKAVREQGLAVYGALAHAWTTHSSWPIARRTCPALVTAYVLAVSLGVPHIAYYRSHRSDVIPMSLAFLAKLKTHAITVSFCL